MECSLRPIWCGKKQTQIALGCRKVKHFILEFVCDVNIDMSCAIQNMVSTFLEGRRGARKTRG